MEKLLKPYTIIPSELYVHRDADRQVRVIIEDMGRPGYVLVSRQMGKTNLLLNAIKELKTQSDIFVYVDLSNYFKSAKECFENIVDTAIETNFHKLSTIENEILEKRKIMGDIPAHKQHSLELRTILRTIPGKLVIILDEIDALTKTDYSDQIFSQIRSVYFSRINFPEFSRLTYLLSGVMEPKEIIKDPKISPFNIGQKIFLNDFSFEEFKLFLSKANLKITKEILERIFYWANGNPRMTWDICSEVENMNNKKITTIDIDNLIKDMYLSVFDKPPIDNIRELVKEDKELRNSIIEIEFLKGNAISDTIKSKLYLSGIINYESDNIKIKNNIIKNALNYDWIRTLEEKDKGLFQFGLEQHAKKRYSEALRLFENYLLVNSLKDKEKSLGYFYAASSASSLRDYKKSISYLDNVKVDERDSLYYPTLLLKSSSYYFNDQVQKSLEFLKIIIHSNKKDEIYFQAKTNYASFIFSIDDKSSESKQIFFEVLNDDCLSISSFELEFINYTKSVCYYNLAKLLFNENKVEQAKSYITLSIDTSVALTMPIKYLTLYNFTININDKKDILSDLIKLIKKEKLIPSDTINGTQLEYTTSDLYTLIVNCFSIDPQGLFLEIIPEISNLSSDSFSENFFNFALTVLESKNQQLGLNLLSFLLDFSDENFPIDENVRYKSIKNILIYNKSRVPDVLLSEYFMLFSELDNTFVDSWDISIFAQLIIGKIKLKEYNNARKYIDIIKTKETIFKSKFPLDYLIILNLNLQINIDQSEFNIAKSYAYEIIDILNKNPKSSSSATIAGASLEIIKNNAEYVLRIRSNNKQDPFLVSKVYSRNSIVKVRYFDGTILETKYKKVINDLLNKKCAILE